MTDVDGMTFWRGVRDSLRSAGVPDGAAALPGDTELPWQGALTITQEGGIWLLSTVDYGRARRVLTRPSREAVALALRQDIALIPLRTPQPLPEEEHERMLTWAAPHVMDLAARAGAGIVIDVPPGLLVNRFGAIDGIYLYPAETSFEARSLPPDVVEQPLHDFVTTGTFRMIASITPPWFGRRGGGLRLEIADPSHNVRSLMRAGLLRRVEVVTTGSTVAPTIAPSPTPSGPPRRPGSVSAEDAERLLREQLDARRTSGGIDAVPLAPPMDYETYWVQTYESRAYLETRDMRHALAGNRPFVVPKDGRTPFWLGTARPIDEQMSALRARDADAAAAEGDE